MSIERREVDPLPTVQRYKKDSSIVNRGAGFHGVAAPATDNLFSALTSAAGMGMEAVSKSKALSDEKDRVRQTSRFLRNMMPSDDATKAGYMAHALRASQNAVTKSTLGLKNLASTFTGTDEQFEEEITKSRLEIDNFLTEKYPNLDQKSVLFQKTLSNMFIEDLDGIMTERAATKFEQEHEARYTTYYDSLMNNAESVKWVPRERREKYLLASVEETGNSLKMDKADKAQVVEKAALMGALSGDDTWLNFTKSYDEGRGTSLFERSKPLQEAEKKLNSEKNTALAYEISVAKADIVDQYVKGGISVETFGANVEGMEKHYGAAQFTRQELQGYHTKRINYIHKEAGGTKVAQGLRTATQVGSSPLSLVTATDEEWKDGCRARATELAKVAEVQSAGLSPELQVEGQVEARRQLLRETVAKGRPNPDWVKDIKTVTGLSYAAYEDDTELPPDILETTSFWKSMDSAARRLYAKDEKDYAFLQNYTDFVELGKPPIAALQAAERAKINQGGITITQVNDLKKKTMKYATGIESKDKFLFWGGKDLTPEMSELANKDIYNKSHALVRSGYNDVDNAVDMAGASWKERNTVLDNGTFVKGSLQYLAGKMPSTNANIQDVQDTMYSYLWGNEEVLENQVQGGGDIRKMWIDTDTQYGTFIIRDIETGDVLSSTKPISELVKYRDEYLINEKGKVPFDSLPENRTQEQAVQDVKDEEAYRLKYMPGVPILTRETMESMRIVQRSDIPEMKDTLMSSHGRTDETISAHKSALTMKMPDVTTKTIPVNADKTQYGFKHALMASENSGVDGKGGWSAKDKLFTTYYDSVGGKDKPEGNANIGYGHLLSKEELSSGKVDINGIKYDYTPGNTEITKDLAERLMEQDMKVAEGGLLRKWEGFSDLPLKYKYVLINLAFNIGVDKVTKTKWPTLTAAMASLNDGGVREEMLTNDLSYTPKRPLTSRRDRIANALGLGFSHKL